MARRRQRRVRGSGAVRQLASGRWQARIQDETGRHLSLGSYAIKADAQHALLLASADQRRSVWIDPRSGRLDFDRYAADWLQGRSTIRPRTRELYEMQLRNHLLPTFGDVELSAINTTAVRQWHAKMTSAERPGAVTIAKCYRLLRTILNTAVEDGLIVKNPCMLKGAGVERSPERPIATIQQVYEIATAVEPRYRALILLATFSALRFGELAALTRRRIDLENGLIEITEAVSELRDGRRLVGEPKTWAGRRTVAIPPVLLHELQQHLDQYAQSGRDGLVFVGPLGGPLRRSNWSTLWRRTVDQLGLQELHFHDLRHTGNTLAAATGASTKELMTRMGHSSSRAALLYQHATRERELAIARRLSEMIEDAT